MWKLDNIKLENFGTYEKLDFKVENGRTFLIQGENKDSLDQESNGSGKSFLLGAIVVGIIGDSFKNVKISDLIKDGEISSTIELCFINSFLKLRLDIKRSFYSSKSSTLDIYLNGGDQKDKFSDVTEGNKYILSLLGLNKKDFLNYFLVSKKRSTSFYLSSDNEKKEIIGRFSGAFLLKNIDKIIDEKVDEILKEILILSSERDKLIGRISTYEEELAKEKTRDLESEKKSLIEELKLKIVKVDLSIREEDRETVRREELIRKKGQEGNELLGLISGLNHEISTNKDKIEKQSKKVKEIGEVIKKKEGEIGNVSDSIQEFFQLKLDAEKTLMGKVICPKCNHTFHFKKSDVSIADIELVKIEAEEAISLLKEKLKEIEIEKNEFLENKKKEESKSEELEEELRKKKNFCRDCEDKKRKIESLITTLENEISSSEIQINLLKTNKGNYSKEIEKIEKGEVVKSRVSEYEDKILNAKQELNKILNKITVQEELRISNSQWKFHFIRFNTYLANKSLKNIEKITNSFLKKANMDLSIRLDGYKTLSNGETRENIDIVVYRNGILVGNLWKLSEGELARIEISTLLCFQYFINLSCEGRGLDFLGVDEVLESVDKKGIENICYNLNSLNKTVFLITHASHDKTFPNLITARKQNGKTKIITKYDE